jgi:hypothetical protein
VKRALFGERALRCEHAALRGLLSRQRGLALREHKSSEQQQLNMNMNMSTSTSALWFEGEQLLDWLSAAQSRAEAQRLARWLARQGLTRPCSQNTTPGAQEKNTRLSVVVFTLFLQAIL